MLEHFQRIGTNLALAIQSAAELNMFTHVGSYGEPFDLGAAPVLFHLQNDPELLVYINGCENNLDNLDYATVSNLSLHLLKVITRNELIKSPFTINGIIPRRF